MLAIEFSCHILKNETKLIFKLKRTQIAGCMPSYRDTELEKSKLQTESTEEMLITSLIFPCSKVASWRFYEFYDFLGYMKKFLLLDQLRL